jgi:hypothetical protein
MRCVRCVVLGVVALSLGTAAPGRADDAPPKDEKLWAELVKRVEEDQKARRQLIDLQARPGGKDAEAARKEVEAATKKMADIDTRNTAWMKEVVGKHGWPGKSLVGTDGAQKAWLLVQHADQDRAFQKRCLPLLAGAVKKGEASPKHLAYLTDRVRVADKDKQVYGTQFHEVGGKLEPYPIEDEANVDRRRKEVGLPPLAEYRKQLEDLYKPTAKDKGEKQADDAPHPHQVHFIEEKRRALA